MLFQDIRKTIVQLSREYKYSDFIDNTDGMVLSIKQPAVTIRYIGSRLEFISESANFVVCTGNNLMLSQARPLSNTWTSYLRYNNFAEECKYLGALQSQEVLNVVLSSIAQFYRTLGTYKVSINRGVLTIQGVATIYFSNGVLELRGTNVYEDIKVYNSVDRAYIQALIEHLGYAISVERSQ